MSTPPSASKPPGDPSRPPVPKPTYVSRNGQMLDSLPLSARLNRAVDATYNFLGLYFVSLFSLDPYTAAMGSRFNTRRIGGVGAGTTRAAGAGSVRRVGTVGGLGQD